MTPILDPVWPWSFLWEIMQRVPVSVRLIGVGAALAALMLVVFGLLKARRRTLYVTASVLATTLILVLRPVWGAMYGFGMLEAVGGCLAIIGLLLAPALLAGVSVGTYLRQASLSWSKLGVILGLRVLAFVLTVIAITRPALSWVDRESVRSQLIILVDRSRSMSVQDELGKSSRWEAVGQALAAGGPALERLRDELGTEVKFYSIDDELAEWSSEQPGEPVGKASEIGLGLRGVIDRRDARLSLRGVLLLSDGADNGSVSALGEASRFRGVPSALHTFVIGNPATTPKQNDVAITSISVSPSPFVPLKGKMKVRVAIDARGFENSKQGVQLRIEVPDGATGKMVERDLAFQNVNLPLTVGNEVTFEADAPATPGEYKVIVQATGVQDDFPFNNRIETFVTVSKEGLAVLLVDRRRGWESQRIFDALQEDARVSVTPVWLSRDKPEAGGAKLGVLDDQPFDVIILGDVSVAQMLAADADFLMKLEKQVARGAGLLVLGGYKNLGNGDWKGTALAKMLPVDLDVGGQIEERVGVLPTEEGKRRAPYILRLDESGDLKQSWANLAKLDGAVPLTLLPPERRGLDTVLATSSDEKTPLLVMRTYAGQGKNDKQGVGARIVVFGGDTTYRWERNAQSRQMHSRFWRQMAVWLARQEDAQGAVWIRPDATSRRIPVRSDLGFAVGARGKGGGPDLADGKFTVEVTAPDGSRRTVPLSRSTSETRGVFQETKQAGTYTITVQGEAKDPTGGVITGQSSARVLVYEEDAEMMRPAADVEFMKKLAMAGGGEGLAIGQLPEFLNRLAEQPLDRGKQKVELRPDWRTTGKSGFLVVFFVGFVMVLTLEWGLRRWWGLV